MEISGSILKGMEWSMERSEGVSVEVVTDRHMFAKLAKPWAMLLKHSGNANLYLSHDWLYTWWLWFGEQSLSKLSIVCIYKNASLLILDEATSALDNESEKRIQKALDEYTKDKITITIAHRLSTIKHADEILVFQQGKIVDRGPHQKLLKHSKVYQRLSGEFKV